MVLLSLSDQDFQYGLGWFSGEFKMTGMRVSISNSEAKVLCRKTVPSGLGECCGPKQKSRFCFVLSEGRTVIAYTGSYDDEGV